MDRKLTTYIAFIFFFLLLLLLLSLFLLRAAYISLADADHVDEANVAAAYRCIRTYIYTSTYSSIGGEGGRRVSKGKDSYGSFFFRTIHIFFFCVYYFLL